MQGWIKDYRKELLSDVWLMPPLYHRVWQYLKYKVNHKPAYVPTKNGKIYIGEGETVTSMRQIAEAVKWVEYGVERIPSPKTIREILDWLQDQEMITRESNRLGTRIKLINYGLYQGADDGESNTLETDRKQSGPTNKNVKNVKKEKRPVLFSPESEPFRAAVYLRNKIAENHPRQPLPPVDDPAGKIQRWAQTMDLLNRKGPPGGSSGYTWAEIGRLIAFCQADPFWKNNILSAEKFREQVVKLEAKMKQTGQGAAPVNECPEHKRLGGVSR